MMVSISQLPQAIYQLVPFNSHLGTKFLLRKANIFCHFIITHSPIQYKLLQRMIYSIFLAQMLSLSIKMLLRVMICYIQLCQLIPKIRCLALLGKHYLMQSLLLVINKQLIKDSNQKQLPFSHRLSLQTGWIQVVRFMSVLQKGSSMLDLTKATLSSIRIWILSHHLSLILLSRVFHLILTWIHQTISLGLLLITMPHVKITVLRLIFKIAFIVLTRQTVLKILKQ